MSGTWIPAALCADIGTSSLKAALVGFDGRLLAFVREPYAAGAGGEVGASDWEAAFLRACPVLVRAGRERGAAIKALCVSGNGPTLVACGARGEPLETLHWHDHRTVGRPETAVPLKSFFLPRAAWLQAHRPGVYDRTVRFLSCQEWLSYRLGAEPAGVLCSPGYAPFFWDDGQIRAFGLDKAKFAPLVPMGSVIGSVASGLAASLGLPPGLPIVAAGTDYFMALVGVGAVKPGLVCDRAGTSEGINVCADRPARTKELLTLPQLRDGLWHVSAQLPTTGRLFEWFRTITGQTDRDYREMLEEIAGASPRDFSAGARGCGGFFFPDVRAGAGLTASSAFVSTAGLTTRAELGRSVVEAIGFMVRGAAESLERHGYRFDTMRLSGGQAKNEAWNRLKADITGKVLEVPEVVDCELVGDACAVLVALGEAGSFEEAADRTVRIARRVEPDRGAYAMHSERCASYRTMQAKMEKFFQ